MAISYNPRIVTDGLVLALDAGNPKSYPGSGTTWTDLSGNGNNGTLLNGVGYNSGNGGSLSFDGTDDYVDCGQYTPIGSFTIDCWVNVDISAPTTTDGKGIVARYSGNGNHRSYMIYYIGSDSKIRFLVNPDGQSSSNTAVVSGVISRGSWYNIEAVFSAGNKIDLYVNGILNSTTSTNTSQVYQFSNQPLAIGGQAIEYGSYKLNGKIPIVKIYNKALTASEIQQNFNATRSRYGI